MQLAPDPLLIQHRRLLRGHAQGGVALDLACGKGHNGLYLAQLGYRSILCDGSFVALRQAQDLARKLHLQTAAFVADLDDYRLPDAAFDTLVVVRFLERSLIEPIKKALRPGGILVFKTFNENWLQIKPGFPSRFTLRHGQLRDWFVDFECVDSNDDGENESTDSHWVGRKPHCAE